MSGHQAKSHELRNGLAGDDFYRALNEDAGVRMSTMRIGALALATLPAVTSAFAGEPLSEEELTRTPVRDRPHPDYDPIGYRIGSIFFHPELSTELRYNSNVYARPTDQRADFALVFSPRLTIRSDAPRFSYKVELGADFYRYRNLTSENRTDAYARVRTHGEITHDLDFDATFLAARRHEMRGDPSAPLNATAPVPYTDIRGEAALTKRFNQLGITAGASARSLTYGTVETLGGTMLDQSWRDATIFTTFVKPFYEFAPGNRAFLHARVNTREYQGREDLNLDSHGYDIRGGLDFLLTSLVTGTIEVGYLSQTFSAPLIPNVEGLSFSGKVAWLVTPLTTITFIGQRSLAERTSPEFPSRVDLIYGAQVDHELLRNVILYAGAKGVRQDFPGTPRKDDVVNVFAGVDYLQSRFARIGLRYEFTDRESTLQQFKFDQHMVMLNVTAKF